MRIASSEREIKELIQDKRIVGAEAIIKALVKSVHDEKGMRVEELVTLLIREIRKETENEIA